MWYKGVGVKSKRLKNIIWHRYEVPWFWEQSKFEIKQRMNFNRGE